MKKKQLAPLVWNRRLRAWYLRHWRDRHPMCSRCGTRVQSDPVNPPECLCAFRARFGLDVATGRTIPKAVFTVRDLGVKVEEYTVRNEFHMYAVDGLPDGVQGRICEQHGIFYAYLLNIETDATPLTVMTSMELALEEIRRLLERWSGTSTH